MEFTIREKDRGRNRSPIKYIINENGCHICISHSLTSDGYCQLKRNGIVQRVHRYVYELHNGKINSTELFVRHKCDTPRCINIKHLEIGTPQDNVNDMVKRDRNAKGSKNGNSRLTESQIVEIKSDTKSKNIELSKKYGVTHQAISLIRKGKIWVDVS